MPYKDDELKKDMLKDVSHADVSKSDDTIDDTDPNYEDYYDVRIPSFFSLSIDINGFNDFRRIQMTFQMKMMTRRLKMASRKQLRLTRNKSKMKS